VSRSAVALVSLLAENGRDFVEPCWRSPHVASGAVYQRVLPSGKKSWVAHVTWQQGASRCKSKRSFATKKEAQNERSRDCSQHTSRAGSSCRLDWGSRSSSNPIARSG